MKFWVEDSRRRRLLISQVQAWSWGNEATGLGPLRLCYICADGVQDSSQAALLLKTQENLGESISSLFHPHHSPGFPPCLGILIRWGEGRV